MKKPFISFLALIIAVLSVAQVKAQSTSTSGIISSEAGDNASSRTLSSEETDRALLNTMIDSLSSEIDKTGAQIGRMDENNEFVVGALERLKLKPSDLKRRIKFENGSLTDKEAERVKYDARLMELLYLLVTPKELGGGGLGYLRVGDLLRFREDPRSRETENADNISAHQYGKAADIVEINKARCTVEGGILGSDEELPPFPVKVIWQGGAPYNPNQASLASFDAAARSSALRDILGAIPGESYGGSIQGFEDLLQQLQRRVISLEAGLPSTSLDYLTNDDVLETLGRVTLMQEFNYPLGALSDGTVESIPRSYLEQSWNLPPGSLKSGADGSWNSALETLGRTVTALQANVSPTDVLKGSINDLKDSPYYRIYSQVEKAYNLPSGVLSAVQGNQPDAFRQVGAAIVADRLHYSADEKTSLIAQAKSNAVTQLSLARVGGSLDLPFPAIALLAPPAGTTKAQAEQRLADFILGSVNNGSFDQLPENIQRAIGQYLPSTKSIKTPKQLSEFLAKSSNRTRLFRKAGAAQMEEIFDLPESSLSRALSQADPPSFDLFTRIVGQRLLEEAANVSPGKYDTRISLFGNAEFLTKIENDLAIPKGDITKYRTQPDTLKKIVGQQYIDTTFRETFTDLYRITTVGLNTLSGEDMYGLLLGKVNSVSVRAGASWVEEDLGMVPDSFSALFADAGAADRLVSAGMSVLGGELFEAFGIDAKNITSGDDFIKAIGRARIETALGLAAGTWRDSLDKVKEKNADRFSVIFIAKENQAEKSRKVDTLMGASPGSTDAFLHGTMTPDTLAQDVGTNNLNKLDTENLQDKLGWDSRFVINGQELLAGIKGQSFKKSGSGGGGSVPNIREILSTIGGYNADVAFGYDPDTMKKWAQADGQAAKNQLILAQGAKLYGSRLGLDLNKDGNLFAAYKDGTPAAVQDVVSSYENRLKDIGSSVAVPRTDVLSIVNGDMAGTEATMATVARAQEVSDDIKNKYETVRTIVRGSSSDPTFERGLSAEAAERYARVLAESGVIKDDSVLDKTLNTVTKGVLSPTGDFNPNASPYSDATRQEIERDYWGTKEARNDYFYGVLDAQIKKNNADLPPEFSEILMEGTLKDRSNVMFSFLSTKTDEGILNTLPTELQPIARAWLASQDPAQGKVLSANPVFTEWASTTFANYTEGDVPAAAIKLAIDYTSGNLDPDVISEDPSVLVSLSRANLGTAVINEQLGLPVGEFQQIYANYQQVQDLQADYASGELDPAAAAAKIDQLVLGGAVSGFVDSVGTTLGLPPGVATPLLEFAITGNPVYLISAIMASGIFDSIFGGEVHCPDLQQEAIKNIHKLIEAVLDIADKDMKLRPHQIITLDATYITALSTKINRLYDPCKNTRCGVFSRPEYAKQVHLGF